MKAFFKTKRLFCQKLDSTKFEFKDLLILWAKLRKKIISELGVNINLNSQVIYLKGKQIFIGYFGTGYKESDEIEMIDFGGEQFVSHNTNVLSFSTLCLEEIIESFKGSNLLVLKAISSNDIIEYTVENYSLTSEKEI